MLGEIISTLLWEMTKSITIRSLSIQRLVGTILSGMVRKISFHIDLYFFLHFMFTNDNSYIQCICNCIQCRIVSVSFSFAARNANSNVTIQFSIVGEY